MKCFKTTENGSEDSLDKFTWQGPDVGVTPESFAGMQKRSEDNPDPIARLIDQACGYDPSRDKEPERPEPTPEQMQMAKDFARDIVSNFRTYYPGVLKQAPSTAAVHLRNTIASRLAVLLACNQTPVK